MQKPLKMFFFLYATVEDALELKILRLVRLQNVDSTALR